jgi:hypothetical protein
LKEWVICRIYCKSLAGKKTPMSMIDIATFVGDLDQRNMSFPLPVKFPTGPEEFAIYLNIVQPIIDPFVPLYSTTGVNTTISPAILPMASMGSYVVQMDTTYFLRHES